MPVQLSCPNCDHILSVPRKLAGGTVRCPMCDAKLEMPASGPPEIRRPAPASPQNEADAAPSPQPPPIQHQRARQRTDSRQGAEASNPPTPDETPRTPAPPPIPKPSRHRPSTADDPEGAEPIAAPGSAEHQRDAAASKPPPLSESRAREQTGSDHSEAESTAPPRSQSEGAPQSLEPAEPPDPPTDTLPVRGYEHSTEKRWTVYQFGAVLTLAALFGAVPAVLDVIAHFQAIESPGVSRWAWALLLASGIQLAYAAYLFQLPDWSSVWTVSIVMLAFATGYAMLLGLLMLADNQSQVVQFLELADTRAGHKATGWCLIMLSICSLLAYFCGRFGVRWHHAYRIVTEDTPAG